MKIGRNAPCPCGSEKKYKHCCLGSDEITTRKINADMAGENRFDYDSKDVFSEDREADGISSEYWESLEKQIPRRLRKKYAHLLKEIRKKATSDDFLAEVEDASYELDKYQKKFSHLLRKTAKFLKRAEILFAEEPFEDMRFTVNDMQTAFEKVGYPSDDDLFFNNMRKYIDCLVDAESQKIFSFSLMWLLPDYVAAKRHIDACIIQHSVMLMDEASKDVVPPFLMCMFMQGVYEWEMKREDEQLEVFSKIGLDPDEIRHRGIEGVESLIQEVIEKNGDADLNELLNDNPELKAFSEAQCYESEKIACALMQHEDASRFLLSFDEVEPWLASFAQELENTIGSDTANKNELIDADAEDAFSDMIFSMCAEMAGKLFTKPRLEQLVNDICAYRKKLRKKDRKKKQAGINFLIVEANNCECPSDSHLLVMLCFNSVKFIINNICESGDY